MYCYQACIRTSTVKVYSFSSVSESESAYDKPFIIVASMSNNAQVILHPSSPWLCKLSPKIYLTK